MNIEEPKQVFCGFTEETIDILIFHFNVAVALDLSSTGPEKTKLDIDAVPGFSRDELKIEIIDVEVHTDLKIYSRTCNNASWNVVAVAECCITDFFNKAMKIRKQRKLVCIIDVFVS